MHQRDICFLDCPVIELPGKKPETFRVGSQQDHAAGFTVQAVNRMDVLQGVDADSVLEFRLIPDPLRYNRAQVFSRRVVNAHA